MTKARGAVLDFNRDAIEQALGADSSVDIVSLQALSQSVGHLQFWSVLRALNSLPTASICCFASTVLSHASTSSASSCR